MEASRDLQRHSNLTKATGKQQKSMKTGKYFWRSADTTREYQLPLKAYRLSIFNTCRDLQRSLPTSSRDQRKPAQTIGDHWRLGEVIGDQQTPLEYA